MHRGVSDSPVAVMWGTLSGNHWEQDAPGSCIINIHPQRYKSKWNRSYRVRRLAPSTKSTPSSSNILVTQHPTGWSSAQCAQLITTSPCPAKASADGWRSGSLAATEWGSTTVMPSKAAIPGSCRDAFIRLARTNAPSMASEATTITTGSP